MARIFSPEGNAWGIFELSGGHVTRLYRVASNEPLPTYRVPDRPGNGSVILRCPNVAGRVRGE